MSESGVLEAQMLEDVNDSIAFSIINDLMLLKRISEKDGTYLKECYKKFHDAKLTVSRKDENILKRTRNLTNEILSEKILLEKVRIEETEEVARLRKMEDDRDATQKEMELAEQRDTLAKFELGELKRGHEDLTKALANMKLENTSIVEPVLERLRVEIKTTADELQLAKEAYIKESNQKKVVATKLEACQSRRKEKEQILMEVQEVLQRTSAEPSRISRQAESIEAASVNMKSEIKNLEKDLVHITDDITKFVAKKAHMEELKKTLDEKNAANKEAIETREIELGAVISELEREKARNNDLITRKIEFNLKKKESESLLRRSLDELNTINKSYEGLKRQLKKKRTIADESKQTIPALESDVLNGHASVNIYRDEQKILKSEVKKLKHEVDTEIVKLLSQENLESSKKTRLEEVLAAVEACESNIVKLTAERKKQGTLLGVLSAQRDIKARECTRIESKEEEARLLVVVKEHTILDLTKSCAELANRFKEFSALHEVVKNERNKYINLIQSSTQALAEMREKIRILQNEVEILSNESSTKDKALFKEKGLHQQAQLQRDSLRQDLNKYLSSYRERQSVVEQQIQEIDKLNNIINNMEKQLLELKKKYEKAVEERNTTGIQLIDRNDELCIIYERSNQQLEAFRKGEIELLRKDEELRMIRLQAENVKRRYVVAKKRIPEIESMKAAVRDLEDLLVVERKKTEDLSLQLEDPKNIDRWRPLEGDDPSLEQLGVKLKVFEERLNTKREHLLEKELVLKELTILTEKLRNQAASKRDLSKSMADQLNSFQTRVRDTTKRMLASVSELSMYQATALRLQQEKARRERILDEASYNFEHGQPPSEEALKEWSRYENKLNQKVSRSRNDDEIMLMQPATMLKTTAEPRPTAYIPEDMAIPQPYGAMAPFKPSEPGSTMRHIKMPIPKKIEI